MRAQGPWPDFLRHLTRSAPGGLLQTATLSTMGLLLPLLCSEPPHTHLRPQLGIGQLGSWVRDSWGAHVPVSLLL